MGRYIIGDKGIKKKHRKNIIQNEELSSQTFVYDTYML